MRTLLPAPRSPDGIRVLVPHADAVRGGVGPLAKPLLGVDDRVGEELADIGEHHVVLGEDHLDRDVRLQHHGLVDGGLELTSDLVVANVVDVESDAFLLLAVVLVLDDELVGVLLQSGADQRTAGLARDAQHAEVARSSRERDLHVRHVLNEDEAFHVRGPIFHVRALGRLAESTVNTIIA